MLYVKHNRIHVPLVAIWITLRYTISYRARWGGSGAL